MPDKKLTDNEIVKALECCNNCDCGGCPCLTEDGCKDIDYSVILDLINRQKAEIAKCEKVIDIADKTIETQAREIERLEAECDKQYEIAEATIRAEIADGGTSCHWCEDKVRIEAYKECIEKVEKKMRFLENRGFSIHYVVKNALIDLLKELVGE